MKDTNSKSNIAKFILIFIVTIIFVIIAQNGVNLVKNISKICIVEEGNLKFEENVEGYILRDEVVLKGENYKNGMVQIISEGQKVSKNGNVFRYYSNSEEDVLKQIKQLDDEINATIEASGFSILSSDITNLENQIEIAINDLYKLNDLEKIQEKMLELNSYVSKKTKITGNFSPADSYVKNLIEKRNSLESSLTESSEIVKAPVSGMVTYKVDGLEPNFGITDFSYLTTEYLKNIKIKSDSVIQTNNECGKVINNFECYIACPIDTEKSSSVKEGEEVSLSFSNGCEVIAKIEKINEEDDDNRVIIFKIKDDVEKLVDYRKVNMDIIWWNYSGLKVSNSALQEENDIAYVERNKVGYVEKVYVKVKRQNDTYSIVENYTDNELEELGLKKNDSKCKSDLKVYDEIILH